MATAARPRASRAPRDPVQDKLLAWRHDPVAFVKEALRVQPQQWQADAQTLRRELTEAGMNPRDIDEIMRDLRALNTDATFNDPQNLAALQAAALDKMKKFEFDLRKKAEGGDQPLSLSGSDEVPASFRAAIAEYYRSLARKKQ